jgi:hypothetical protein
MQYCIKLQNYCFISRGKHDSALNREDSQVESSIHLPA